MTPAEQLDRLREVREQAEAMGRFELALGNLVCGLMHLCDPAPLYGFDTLWVSELWRAGR